MSQKFFALHEIFLKRKLKIVLNIIIHQKYGQAHMKISSSKRNYLSKDIESSIKKCQKKFFSKQMLKKYFDLKSKRTSQNFINFF